MNEIPKPSGYDVYWEKWIDAFEQGEIELENEINNIEGEFTNEELLDLESQELFQSTSHIKSIITPFGVLPLTEQTMASKYRFRIAVGKMFVDRDVMTSVRDAMVRYVDTTKSSSTTTDNKQHADQNEA